MIKLKYHPLCFFPHVLLLLFFSFSDSSLAVDFVFNGFNFSDVLLYGNATVDSGILSLTHDQAFSIGRALYPQKIPTKIPNSSFVYRFSASFIFAMAPYKNILPGHGFVFIFTPVRGIQGANSAQHLGFLNFTNNGDSGNHVFGVEFDVFMNQEFDDINANHVGIDVNSLKSIAAHDAGYWPEDDNDKSFQELKLNDGENYQVWIDYEDSLFSITMAPVGTKRPRRPLLNVSLNLSEVFEDEMYVGFTSSTGQLVQSHKILAWSFSNSNFSLSEALITSGLPSFVLPKDSIIQSKGFIAGLTIGIFFLLCFVVLLTLFLIQRKRRKAREREAMEDWELEYWPHRITYEEIESATKGFSEENVIGIGGNGKVYKGNLGGTEIAVKRISHENNGMREFLAEISSLGRLKHRNLVKLRGWCKKDAGNFLLIYEYMENGSLEKRVFENEEDDKILNGEERIRILKDVACGVVYLHEGSEAKVVHRDIKASNVLLDKELNGRLGDFGLALMQNNKGEVASTTKVVGTVGYMAPEMMKTGRASIQSDVYMVGILVLEVMCGRRPIEEGKPSLVEWVWQLKAQGQLISAMDERLRAKGEVNEQQIETILNLGLLCAYPDPKARPTMRQVLKVLEGKSNNNNSNNNEDGDQYDESEDLDTYLLKHIRSPRDIWSEYSNYFNFSSHPTFEDVRLHATSHSSSTSRHYSFSHSIVDGR
ncbi:L-type lectin-domain containing receptor kinase VII.1 isoform X1 [Prosopis cineraria]|uniref:L-type lectin-domain containing receptor kinase VII.1 isoform X1 n=1 Tax=Prosopis cineraria TaxID=364024 RepID=UPI0024108CEB|nr:L-type lectin-domain containing receptor kinase VII.1 isoform X1 [Prosopis cineraria]